MKLTYEELFKIPYFYNKNVFVLDPFIAANINYIKRIEAYPFYFFETLTTEPKRDYGNGFVEDGLNFGHGVSFQNPEEAMCKSIFESLERKFAKVYNPKDLITASYNEIKNKAIDPHKFSLPSGDEFKKGKLPYVKYSADLKLHWKECMQILPGETKAGLLPASLVYSRYSWKNQKERIAPILSPGTAAHMNYRKAILNGLCEVIERDAFMVTWLQQISCPQIEIDISDFDVASELFKHLTLLGFKISFFNITTDVGVPVVLSVIEHNHLMWNGTICFGLGCDINPKEALLKSFLECLAGLSNYISFDYENSEVIVNEESILKKFDWDNSQYFKHTHFLKNSKHKIKLSDIPSEDRGDTGKNLETLIKILAGKKLEMFALDLTPRNLNDSKACIVRSFIAGLQPMVYDIDCFRLSNRRIYNAKSQMGHSAISKKKFEYDDLNLMPHPFAAM